MWCIYCDSVPKDSQCTVGSEYERASHTYKIRFPSLGNSRYWIRFNVNRRSTLAESQWDWRRGNSSFFFNTRYCTRASTDPKSVPLFPRKMDLERGFKDSRTQIQAWKFSHHISSKFALSEDFSLELHLNPGHFSLSEERGVYLYLCF